MQRNTLALGATKADSGSDDGGMSFLAWILATTEQSYTGTSQGA